MINALKRLFRKPEQGPMDEGNDIIARATRYNESVPAITYYRVRDELWQVMERNYDLVTENFKLKEKLSRSHQKRDAKGRFVKS